MRRNGTPCWDDRLERPKVVFSTKTLGYSESQSKRCGSSSPIATRAGKVRLERPLRTGGPPSPYGLPTQHDRARENFRRAG